MKGGNVSSLNTPVNFSEESIQQEYQRIYNIRIALLKCAFMGATLTPGERDQIVKKLAIEKLSEQYKINLRADDNQMVSFDYHDVLAVELTKHKPSMSYRNVAAQMLKLGCQTSEARVRRLWMKNSLLTREERFEWVNKHLDSFDLKLERSEEKKIKEFLKFNKKVEIPAPSSKGDVLVHRLLDFGAIPGVGQVYVNVWMDLAGDTKSFIWPVFKKDPKETFDFFRQVIVPHYKRCGLKIKCVVTDGSALFSNESWLYCRGLQYLQIRHIVDYKENTEQIKKFNNCYQLIKSHFDLCELNSTEFASREEFVGLMVMTFLSFEVSLLEREDEVVRPYFEALDNLKQAV